MKTVSQKFLSLVLAICLCFAMMPTSSASAAVTAMAWTYVGDQGYFTFDATDVSLTVDDSGAPYVAFLNNSGTAANKVAAAKFNGTNWAGFGKNNVSGTGRYNSSPSMAVDNNGMPYVAYTSGEGTTKGKVVVASNGSNAYWGPVSGSAASPGNAQSPSLVVDSGNTPYVAYTDGSNGNRATVRKFDGTSWVSVGNEGFSSGEADYISLAIDKNGTPYVSYTDGSNGKKATVMKLNGASWETVGSADISKGEAYTSLAFGSDGTPYIAFEDFSDNVGKVNVMKLDGSDWKTVGKASFSAGGAGDIQLAFDGSGIPYVAYQDYANGNKATVMKFDGSDWNAVGTPGFSGTVNLAFDFAIDGSGMPYVAYVDGDNNHKLCVMKYSEVPGCTVTYSAGENGSLSGSESEAVAIGGHPSNIPAVTPNSGYGFIGWSCDGGQTKLNNMQLANQTVTADVTYTAYYSNAYWAKAGTAGFSSGEADYTSIAIDKNGTPYVAFKDYGNSNKATVMKLNGSNWELVGNAGISAGEANYVSLAIGSDGTPYVAYQDYGNGNKATVMKWNGSNWEPVGSVGFSGGEADYVSLAIDKNGTPYVAYKDCGNSNGATVMKYTDSGWEPVGSVNFSAGETDYVSLALDKNGTPYAAFKDYNNSRKATVMKLNGSSWETCENAGFSTGEPDSISLALDSDGTPYVAYQDYSNGNKATVMKLNGSSWESVGGTALSEGGTGYLSLVIGSDGTPYAAYQDANSNNQVTVKKFDGSNWVPVGMEGLSDGETDFISLAVGSDGTPYVAYDDYTKDYKSTVMKYTVNATHTITYNAGAHGSFSGSGSESVVSGGCPLHIPTVTPNSNYVFAGWSCNGGQTLLTNDQLAAIKISADVTYTAYYTESSSAVAVTGVTLSRSSLSLTVGGAPQTLTAEVAPANVTNKNVAWSTSDSAVATVKNGVVTPVSAGTAKITVTTEDGGKTDSCTVTVTSSTTTPVAVTGVTLSQSSLSLTTGGAPQTLTAEVTPANATNKNINWFTGNSAVATVKNGVVTPVSAGTAIITATTEDGGKTASCTVTVTAASDTGSGGSSGGSSSHHSSSTNNSGNTSAPSLPSSVTDASTRATADLSGATFPAEVTSAALAVTPGATADASDPQAAAVYNLAVSGKGLNIISTPVLYNIKLLDQNGNAITFTGSVQVKIPVPAGLSGTPHVFRYETNGTFTDMNAKVVDRFLVFTTTHFSYYTVAGTGDSITLDTRSYQMLKNGSYQIGVKLTGSKAATVKCHSTNDKIAAVAKLKNGNCQVTAKGVGTAYIMFDVYDSKNKLLTHASVRIDVKAGIRPRGDSTRQIGLF